MELFTNILFTALFPFVSWLIVKISKPTQTINNLIFKWGSGNNNLLCAYVIGDELK